MRFLERHLQLRPLCRLSSRCAVISGAALSAQWRGAATPRASLCHLAAPADSGGARALQSLGFSRSQLVHLAPRLPSDQAELSDALERLGEAVALLRQLGLSQPQAALTKLGAPACYELEGEELHQRLQLLCQFLTKAACARLLASKPQILARDTGEISAIADYLVKQCGYATDVLALIPAVWQLTYLEVVTRREIFVKAGRLSKQPKRQFNQRGVAGCDCFSGGLTAFLQRAGVSRAEYDMYAEIVGHRLQVSQRVVYTSDEEAEGSSDEEGDSEADDLADGADDYNQ